MTGKQDRTARLDVGPWFGGTEATDHEAEARSRVNRKKAKTVLRLPDLEHAKVAVLNSLTSADAQRGYRHAIDEFVGWYCPEPRLAFNRIVVLRYRSYLESRQLAPGTVNLRLGAVRRLTYEAADCGPRQNLSQGHQNGKDMVRLHDRKVDLAHCEELRETDRYA